SLANDADANVKRSSARALGKLGKQSIAADEEPVNQIRDALTKALADGQPAVRQNAAWAIGQLGAKSGVPALPKLRSLLNDPDPLVRRDAAGALREFGASAQPAVSSLLACFKSDKDLEVRRSAVNADFQIFINIVGPQNKDATRELSAGLRDGDTKIVHD